jgi:hypothetical protein
MVFTYFGMSSKINKISQVLLYMLLIATVGEVEAGG